MVTLGAQWRMSAHIASGKLRQPKGILNKGERWRTVGTHLAKVGGEGSNPFARSIYPNHRNDLPPAAPSQCRWSWRVHPVSRGDPRAGLWVRETWALGLS